MPQLAPGRTGRATASRLLLVLLLCALGALAHSSPLDAAELHGTITDPDDRPVAGVRVMLTGTTAPAAVVTDEQGRYRIPDLSAGRYDVHAIRRGFRAEPIRLVVAADDARELNVTLRLSAVTESVVVSASVSELSRSHSPASVTVVTREDLEARQVETVADALRLVPGMEVVRSGGRGSVTSLLPRGGESDFTLVLVDGMRLNAFGGGFDFAQLPVGDVERIEVVRGPQSALYGSDAIGAVVQIFTRHGGPSGIDGSFEQGSFDTTHATLSTSGTRGALGWGVSAERLTTSGFTGRSSDTGERVTNDDHDLTNAAFSGSWRSASATRLRGDVRLTSTERGFPGPFGSDPLNNVTAIDRVSRGTSDSVLASLDLSHAWSDRLAQRMTIVTSDLDGGFVSPFGRSTTETRRTSLRIQNDIRLTPDLRFASGIELLGERARSTFITGASADPIPVRRRVVGLFGEGRYDSGDRAVVTLGIRLERISRSALEPDPNAFQPRPAFVADTVVSANPKLSVSYFLQPAERRTGAWTRLRLNAGTGIRPPDAFEIAFTDNPSLAPERSRSLDVGIEQAVLGGAGLIEVTAFYNRYDDLIVAVGRSFADASQFRTDNISNARARGLELQGSYRAAWGLEARVGYTWLDTDVLAVDGGSGEAPAPFSVGQPLLRRPRHHGSLDLALTRDRVTLFGTLNARGGVLDVEPSFGAFGGLLSAPGYTTLDLGAQVRLRRDLRIFARVSNALDRVYEEALGFPALGRAFTMGLRVAAGR